MVGFVERDKRFGIICFFKDPEGVLDADEPVGRRMEDKEGYSKLTVKGNPILKQPAVHVDNGSCHVV